MIEKLIADEIEAPAAQLFRKVLIDQVWPLSEEERVILATVFALQYARGSNRRRALDEIAQIIANMLEGEGGLDTASADWPDKLKAAHIQSMLDFERTGPCFFLRPWTLVRFDRKRLLTCDTPITLHPFPGAPASAAVGIGTAGSIRFPMSRTAGFVMFSQLIESEEQAEEIASGQFDRLQLARAPWHMNLTNPLSAMRAKASITIPEMLPSFRNNLSRRGRTRS